MLHQRPQVDAYFDRAYVRETILKGWALHRRHVAPAVKPKERHLAGLLSEREALMNEIALRARLGRLPPMLAKAKTLLTNFWARSDWAARAELLPVARMLLVLGAAQPALKPGAAGVGASKPGISPRSKGRSSEKIAG